MYNLLFIQLLHFILHYNGKYFIHANNCFIIKIRKFRYFFFLHYNFSQSDGSVHYASISLLYYRLIYVVPLLQNKILSYKPPNGKRLALRKIRNGTRFIRLILRDKPILFRTFNRSYDRRCFIRSIW